MNKPKISVVTVTYNSVSTLEETIQSVLNQTYDKIDYIVIDGGSTDGTVDIIKKYADRLAYWVSEPDKGIYDAMNKGINAASGDYINFMNSGDSFANSSIIQKVVSSLDPNSDILYGSATFIDGKTRIQVSPHPYFEQIGKKIKSLGICHQGIFARTSLLKNQLFDVNFKICADFHQIKTLIEKGATIEYLPLTITNYNLDGISHLKYKERIKENAIICGINPKSLWLKYHILMFSIKKGILTLLKRNNKRSRN